MSSVPLGIIGIFPGHWLVGADFSATSMVGIIALSGAVMHAVPLVFRRRSPIMGVVQVPFRRGRVRKTGSQDLACPRPRSARRCARGYFTASEMDLRMDR